MHPSHLRIARFCFAAALPSLPAPALFLVVLFAAKDDRISTIVAEEFGEEMIFSPAGWEEFRREGRDDARPKGLYYLLLQP